MLKKITALALCSLTLLALAAPPARPALAAPAIATFNVNSTLDEVDDTPGNGLCHTDPFSPAAGACTLRAAVMEANFSSGAGAVIMVPSGIYTLTIPASGGDDASTGDLNLIVVPVARSNRPVADPVIALVGAGAAQTIINANQIDRVLSVGINRVATVSGVTLRGGYATLNGGGLYNNGTLTVTHSTISGNQAVGYGGGGALNNGSLALVQSTLAANSAPTSGGGVYNLGALLVDRSTFDGNHANYGGAIVNSSAGSVILINSTLGQNYSVNSGGAIYNDGQVNIYSTTIAGNWADSERQGAGAGGGVFNSGSGTFNLRNSLLAGNNLGDAPVWDDCNGTLQAYGTDFVGLEGDDQVGCTIVPPLGVNLYKLNSLNYLSGLQDNGGPTWTIALLAGSSAIMDGGNAVTCIDQNAAPLATDQRGAVRVLGGNCDIGAFEFLPPAAYLPLMRH